MDFLMKQQSTMLNANCQLIQCTLISDLLSNLKGLLDSMIINAFIVMCQNHETFIGAVPWYTTSTCLTITTLRLRIYESHIFELRIKA